MAKTVDNIYIMTHDYLKRRSIKKLPSQVPEGQRAYLRQFVGTRFEDGLKSGLTQHQALAHALSSRGGLIAHTVLDWKPK